MSLLRLLEKHAVELNERARASGVLRIHYMIGHQSQHSTYTYYRVSTMVLITQDGGKKQPGTTGTHGTHGM